MERKEGQVAKAVAWEEGARLKELRVAKHAKLQAQQQIVREEAQCVQVQHMVHAAATKAAKAAEQTQKRNSVKSNNGSGLQGQQIWHGKVKAVG